MRPVLLLVLAFLLCSIPVTVLGIGLPAGTNIELAARADYTVDTSDALYAEASTVITVGRVAGAAIEHDAVPWSVESGTSIYIPLRIVNTGNASDDFDIEGHSASGWNVEIVYDSNSDGVHQAGENYVVENTMSVVADGWFPCFAKVDVPAGATAGDTVAISAVSGFDSANGSAAVDLEIPKPNTTPTSVSAEIDTNPAYVGQQVMISGALSVALSTSLSMEVVSPSDGTTSILLQTENDGAFETYFTPSESGEYILTIVFNGSEEYAGCSTELTLHTNALQETAITVVPSAEAPEVGDTVTIAGTFSPAAQVALLISITDPGGGVEEVVANTNAQGGYSLQKEITAQGAWEFIVTFAGSESMLECSNSVSVEATEPVVSSHEVIFTEGPSVNPTSVASGGTTNCAAQAEDSEEHTVTYHWSDGGAGGTFTPNANVRNPAYTAPVNSSGQNVSVTLTCTAACSDDGNVQASDSVILTVRNASGNPPQVIGVYPENGASCVDRETPIVIHFDQPMDRASVQQALVSSPGLSLPQFAWSGGDTLITITHQGLFGEQEYVCSLGATARGSSGSSLASAVEWSFVTGPNAVFDPGQVSAMIGEEFLTPPIVLKDMQMPGTAAVVLTVPEGFIVDETIIGDNLACVTMGSDIASMSSSWDPVTREMSISVSIPQPATEVEIVESIALTAPETAQVGSIQIDGCPALATNIITMPGDFNGDSRISITDASLFIQEWVFWHSDPLPIFDKQLDLQFDLAPYSTGVWPNWKPIGDRRINISDAAAFIKCWTGSHPSPASFGPRGAGGVEIRVTSEGIEVIATAGADGVFEASVPLPDNSVFDSSTDSSGNLMNVVRGAGCGSMFFTEYEPQSRTVNLTGNANGASGKAVATIRLKQ